MERVEIQGRLRENIIINGKSFECKDVNLDSDFLLDYAKHMLAIVFESTDATLKYSKDFKDEIVTTVSCGEVYKTTQFNVTFVRATFSDKVLITVRVETNSDSGLFGDLYNLKVELLEVMLKQCVHNCLYILKDTNNEGICASAYLKIHNVENRLRSIMATFMVRKYGKLALSKKLADEVDEYSKWFKKVSKDKYKTFKKINTDYSNLDFVSLLDVLQLKEVSLIDADGLSINQSLEILRDDLSGVIDLEGVLNELNKLQNSLKDSPSVFESNYYSPFDKTAKVNRVLEVLDYDFQYLWKNDLSKMRNMIMHNKPICNELYDDISTLCFEVETKFNELSVFLDSTWSDEDGIYSALEDEAYEEEYRQISEVAFFREQVGISFPLSEDGIKYRIIDKSKNVEGLMTVLGVLDDIRGKIGEIETLYDSIECVSEENEEDDYLKERVYTALKKELKLTVPLQDFKDDSLITMVNKILTPLYDVERMITYYQYHEGVINQSDIFDFDYHQKWLTINGEEFELVIDAQIDPQNGYTEDVIVHLIEDEVETNYVIELYYGDYTNESEGCITDFELIDLKDKIEPGIDVTYAELDKLFELLNMVDSICND